MGADTRGGNGYGGPAHWWRFGRAASADAATESMKKGGNLVIAALVSLLAAEIDQDE